jgi:hypothetical protein
VFTFWILSRLSCAARVRRVESCSRQPGRPMVGARRCARAGSAGEAEIVVCTRDSHLSATPSNSPCTCQVKLLRLENVIMGDSDLLSFVLSSRGEFWERPCNAAGLGAEIITPTELYGRLGEIEVKCGRGLAMLLDWELKVSLSQRCMGNLGEVEQQGMRKVGSSGVARMLSV